MTRVGSTGQQRRQRQGQRDAGHSNGVTQLAESDCLCIDHIIFFQPIHRIMALRLRSSRSAIVDDDGPVDQLPR